MSDDGYYADSPYDEFEEMLWDADPAPNLADDLAQHAAYSPVWQDDPIGELEQYHSDWEYYSDDYFDDDPVILRNNPADGSPLRNKNASIVNTKRGRKRKFDETQEKMGRLELQSLSSTIRGTVWAQNTIPHVKVFQDGQHEKVALLTDWKERFQFNRKKGSSVSRTKLERDESWANDLSLADMGLMHVRESRSAQPELSPEDEDIDEQETSNADDPLLDTDHALEDMEGGSLQKTSREKGSTLDERLHEENGELPGAVSTGETVYSRSSKRSKLSAQSSPPRSRQDDANEQNLRTLRNNSAKVITAAVIPHTGPGKDGQNQDETTAEGTSTNAKTGRTMNSRTSKKRRLSSPLDEESNAITSTVSSRAKRVASSKVGTTQPDAAAAQRLPGLGTRSAKARKR